MSVLVCSPRYGGCGFVGRGEDFQNSGADADLVVCPLCHEDAARQVTQENATQITGSEAIAVVALMMLLNSSIDARQAAALIKTRLEHLEVLQDLQDRDGYDYR